MKHFITLWLDTPRWLRGLFLGNIGYIVFVAFGFNVLQDRYPPSLIFVPTVVPVMVLNFGSLGLRFVLVHIAWCTLGALWVQWLGEKKGIVILMFLMYAIGIVIFYVYVEIMSSSSLPLEFVTSLSLLL